jgi:uncharacterized protein
MAVKLSPLPQAHIKLTGGFWAEKQEVNRQKTIPAIHAQLEKTGRIDSWLQDKSRDKRNTRSMLHRFFDSDLAKWLEAVAYSLQNHPDEALEKELDAIIEMIAKAQMPDGYLNSYFMLFEPEKRWTNLKDNHEMYNAGHLIEAAVAYYQARGKRKFLDVTSRYAEHIGTVFGAHENQKHGYCGHPEIELALVRLYHATGEKRYLELSSYFIDERGKLPHYFDIEAQARGENINSYEGKIYRYHQAHAPLREQDSVVGHAVRACYLYAGVADIARETGDTELLEVSRHLWDDLTNHQMYITGGLGPAHSNEGFTFAYDLPNESAYAETCAGIALIFWAQRMFHLDPHGRYIDVLERVLYNNVLSGVSCEGENFFYANPLGAFPYVTPYGVHNNEADKHYRRKEWFACPCCPPNLARLIASLGTYFYSSSADTVFVHLYNDNRAQFRFADTQVQIEQKTNYPWDGEIHLRIQPEKAVSFEIALRFPAWCRGYSLQVNNKPYPSELKDGYLRLRREWQAGDKISLMLEMPVERIDPHPAVRQDAGQIALQRGPLVYCLEEVDNGANLAKLTIPTDAQMQTQFDADFLGGAVLITGDTLEYVPENWKGGLYQSRASSKFREEPRQFKAIPYFMWANRESGEMRIWMRES